MRCQFLPRVARAGTSTPRIPTRTSRIITPALCLINILSRSQIDLNAHTNLIVCSKLLLSHSSGIESRSFTSPTIGCQTMTAQQRGLLILLLVASAIDILQAQDVLASSTDVAATAAVQASDSMPTAGTSPQSVLAPLSTQEAVVPAASVEPLVTAVSIEPLVPAVSVEALTRHASADGVMKAAGPEVDQPGDAIIAASAPAEPEQYIVDTPVHRMSAQAASETEDPEQQLVDTPVPRLPAKAAPVVAAGMQLTVGQVAPMAAPPAQYQGILGQHNSYRALHGVPALTWDDTVASSAAAYAAQCIWGHDANNDFGENLYATTDKSDITKALADAIKVWYDEIADYNWNSPGFQSGTGHFTQVVWKSTTKLGCVAQLCGAGFAGWSKGGTYVVCRYDPPGNYVGSSNFKNNVLPPVSSNPSPASPSPSPAAKPPSPSPTPAAKPSPTPVITPSPTPGVNPSPSPDSAQYQGILGQHNSYRALHGVPALTWDGSLASSAAAYAAQCIWGHDTNNDSGENLYATTDKSDITKALANAIKVWYDEVADYNWNSPGFQSGTGHFTQVVWKSTTNLGCVAQICGAGFAGWSKGGTYVVCRYLPPGNSGGSKSFTRNVLPLVSANSPSPSPSPTPTAAPSPSPKPVTPSPSPKPPVTPSPTPRPVTPSPNPVVVTPSPSPAAPPTPSPSPSPSTSPATLPEGYYFSSPGCLPSASRVYWLCMQSDANLVLWSYAKNSNGAVVWSSNTKGVSKASPFRLSLKTSGNLNIFDAQNSVLWTTNTSGKGVAPRRLVVEDSGNVVLYDSINTKLWETKTTGL